MTDAALLEKYGFIKEENGKKVGEEEIEVGTDMKGHTTRAKTGYPKPDSSYIAVHQIFNQSIEENYFWTIEFLRVHEGFHDIVKITDIFTASEHSSFFGSAQQRLGIQQDKVSQFLATIGKMVKELFQLVRELRILDERISYYEDSFDPKSRSRASAEITLKGIWIDMVEQGAKNPASVYGMSRELQFTTLPDLFFSVHPKTINDIDQVVESLDFNRKVKEVLARKLRTYMEWKNSTYKELLNRRLFTLKYLRQHFDIIKMYMNWVKPYLRNIQRLQMQDETKSPDLIAAFEGSLIEIEILARKLPQYLQLDRAIEYNQYMFACISCHISYRAAPQMAYQQEYQKGPLHVGKTDWRLRGYVWDEKKIKKYLDMKSEEDFRLLESVDASVKAAMEALGDELLAYLKEAGEKINLYGEAKKEEKNTHKPSSIFDPFTSIVKGFSDIIGGGHGKHDHHHDHHDTPLVRAQEKDVAKKATKQSCYQTYKEFKKKCGIIHW